MGIFTINGTQRNSSLTCQFVCYYYLCVSAAYVESSSTSDVQVQGCKVNRVTDIQLEDMGVQVIRNQNALTLRQPLLHPCR